MKNKFLEAVYNNDVSALKLLLEVHPDVIDQEPNLLDIACFEATVDVLCLLVEYGYDVDHRNHIGNTPLISAAISGNIQAAMYLLLQGADVNCLGFQHCSPLMFAAQYYQPKMVHLLLAAGADTEIKDEFGRTALDLAISNDSLDAARILN